MTFVFPILLGGLAMIGIPVLIHLIMRKKPKIQPFPAFRFLLQRQRINVRRLRLRHLLLLAMRILLIVCIVLALARPQVFFQSLNLRGDQPIAVVMIFDTSITMQYKSNTGISRLEQAKNLGLELIDKLPTGSRVAVLDTADQLGAGGTQWYQVMSDARERIGKLHWKPANSPVSSRLEHAYRLLGELANSKEDERERHLPRLVLMFSDRTRSSWDTPFGDVDNRDADGKGSPFQKVGRIQTAADQIPVMLAGVLQARDNLPSLIDLLGQFREKLGVDSGNQELLGSLTKLKELLPHATIDDLNPSLFGSELPKHIDVARKSAREMILALGEMKLTDADKEYHEKLLTGLHKLLDDLAGARAFYIDVGIDRPIDLALLALDLPSASEGQMRQVFNENESFVLRARVQATGKDVSTTLTLQAGKKELKKNLDIKAGPAQDVLFHLDCQDFGVGQHSAEVKLATEDSLPGNDSRYVTFAVRPAQRVLVLSDDPPRTEQLARALAANNFVAEVARPLDQPSGAFRVSDVYDLHEGVERHTARPLERPTTGFKSYQAVFLDGLDSPTEPLWGELEEYVSRGGGVAVIPGGSDMNKEAYNHGRAQKILPGTWTKLVTNEEKPAVWNLSPTSLFRHRLTKPFAEWNDKKRGIDFILRPRSAIRYWEVQPNHADMVLVKYDESPHPALLERLSEPPGRTGKVLMFTTTLGSPRPGAKGKLDKAKDKVKDLRWNNYLESTTSFFPVLIGLSTRYLTNEAELAQLNFVCGRGSEPTVQLPTSPRFLEYHLKGPDVDEPVRVLPADNEINFSKKAIYPGNYSVSSVPPNEGKFTARFSLNLPADEGNPTRLPIGDLESVLGKGRVLQGQESTSLHDIMQGAWSEPVELLPTLLMAILLVLAIENLLANRFYNTDWAYLVGAVVGFFSRRLTGVFR